MKRTVWLTVGFGLGVYVGEKVRRAVVQATPDAVADRVRGAWSDALAAGRTEMRARERALRETFAAPDPDRDRGDGRAAGTAGESDPAGR